LRPQYEHVASTSSIKTTTSNSMTTTSGSRDYY